MQQLLEHKIRFILKLRYSEDAIGFLGVPDQVKNLPALWEIWAWFLGWEDPLEEGMATHSSILPGEFHGQRSLADYSAKSQTMNDFHVDT